ncbi:DUF4349 domain-containing protein [Cryobacterium sp. TMB3-1-2]|nr:DUF4349 domain-containing protein [Cryobacterium sp. TMB3-1-2]TFC66106.1 DUF4349 domain-containing protein [Cryobacterium sp. TMB3-15]TFC78611.1 DUF4349 domain-containing protein [Cryobacterium sp. TMB3-10]TFD40297.1 DUF4349 domain-containing protein [Cryobacterium sp. TMB3-12]
MVPPRARTEQSFRTTAPQKPAPLRAYDAAQGRDSIVIRLPETIQIADTARPYSWPMSNSTKTQGVAQGVQARRPRRLRTWVGVTGGLAIIGLLLAGCTSLGSQSASDSGYRSESMDSGTVPGQLPAPGEVVAGDVVEDAAGEATTADRSVITTGSVSLTVADPIRSAENAAMIVEEAGGRVDSRTETPETENQSASANLSLRIPVGDLDRTLDALRALGTVNYVSLNSSDVTQQSQDLDARITALRTSVDRLLALISQATTTTDLIAIESELSSRQAELEGMQSQRDYLTDQIEYSTIGLELYSTGTVAPGAPDNFWTGVVAGWNTLVTALGALLVGVGFALPWLAILAVAGGIVFLIVRLATRKEKAT